MDFENNLFKRYEKRIIRQERTYRESILGSLPNLLFRKKWILSNTVKSLNRLCRSNRLSDRILISFIKILGKVKTFHLLL